MVLNNEKQTQMNKRDLMRISIVAIAAFAMSSCGQMKELQANMDQLKMQVQDLTTDDDQDGVSNNSMRKPIHQPMHSRCEGSGHGH